MLSTMCDAYFENHIAKNKYFSFDGNIRCCAIKTAATDLASCGVGGISSNSPEILRTALFEQTIFVLCHQEDYAAKEKEIVSESIDGIGSCRYTPSGCPAHISPRAFALVNAFFRTGQNRLTRG
ncbi:MAG: hypothetical protein IJW08_05165 [Lentisphaeria bacterium]|nr:hypothetical protein [Lentisphaeria bacterium]MBQ7395906.1 hypothetical protein [Lentisphaeria bacterium]MBR7119280.1 hypothetical protein [Lentisphaeria bacterium]